MFASTQVPLAEMVATAVFSKQMLLPARWSDVAGGDTIVLRVVFSAVGSFLFLWTTISTQTSVMLSMTLTALVL